MPEYDKFINGRYPFNTKAKRDVDLKHFVTFFGEKGHLNQFYTQYIHPFIDTRGIDWQAKTIDDLQIHFAGDVLAQFERADIIRKMFFAPNSMTPQVNFSLTPANIPEPLSSLAFDLNGQKTQDYRGTQNLSSFSWPESMAKQAAFLTFVDLTGMHIAHAESGMWAWFRLLHQSEIAPTIDPTHFVLSFDLNGTKSSDQLITN